MQNVIKMLTHMLFAFGCMMSLGCAYDAWTTVVLYALGAALLSGYCYFMRVKAKKIWVFLGSQMSCVLIVIGFTFIGLPKWYIAISVLVVLHSLIVRLAEGAKWLDAPNYMYVGIMVFVYAVLTVYREHISVKEICIWVAVFLFLFKILHGNLESVREYVELRKLSAEVDEKKVKRLSTQLTFFFTTTLGVILIVVGVLFLNAQSIWDKIGVWLKGIVRYIVTFLWNLQEPPKTPTEVQTDQENAKNMADMFQNLAEEKDPSQFLLVLEKVLLIVVTIALVILAIVLLVRMAIFVYRYFYSRTEHESEEQVIEKLEAVEILPRERRKFSWGFEHNPAKRIRKIYKKQMKHFGANKLERFKFMTPDEQLQTLREYNIDERIIEEVRMLYEKARYSNETITEQEASRMHGFMKK